MEGRGRTRRIVLVCSAIALALALASCERTPTKAEYVDRQVAVECADQSGEAFKLCRLEIIRKYMDVPLEEMQKNLPPPPMKSPFACSRSN